MIRKLYTSKRFDFIETKENNKPIVVFLCPVCSSCDAWIDIETIEKLQKEPYFICQKCNAKFKNIKTDLWDLID